jgi:hypothetical protein
VKAYFKELTEEIYYEAYSEENLFFWQCLNFWYGLSTGYTQSIEERTTKHSHSKKKERKHK